MSFKQYQTQTNYHYNHEYVGCVASLNRDQYLLTCEVFPKQNKKRERYEENFFVDGELRIKAVNKGKFPTETGLLERKMYYYINKHKEILKEARK